MTAEERAKAVYEKLIHANPQYGIKEVRIKILTEAFQKAMDEERQKISAVLRRDA